MSDKDIAAIMTRMGPLADAWYFCDLPTARASTAEQLREVWGGLSAPWPACQVSTHADPAGALNAALSTADPADRIVVFGSFLTVGGVLQQGLPRLDAPHLN
jgi:dihydrofolate synthase/folylpolyglutamate synthase